MIYLEVVSVYHDLVLTLLFNVYLFIYDTISML